MLTSAFKVPSRLKVTSIKQLILEERSKIMLLRHAYIHAGAGPLSFLFFVFVVLFRFYFIYLCEFFFFFWGGGGGVAHNCRSALRPHIGQCQAHTVLKYCKGEMFGGAIIIRHITVYLMEIQLMHEKNKVYILS